MVVENTSALTKDDAFKALHSATKLTLYKKYMYSAILLAGGIGILIYGLINSDSQYISFGAVLGGLGLAYAIFNTVMIVLSPKDVKKKNQEICENGVTYQYKFKEHSCDLVVISSTKKSKVNYDYKDFKLVYEYDDKFEIILQAGPRLYVLKSGFENNRMIDFFIKNLGTNKKLKIINKIKK